MSWAEGRRTLNQLSHPGAPNLIILNKARKGSFINCHFLEVFSHIQNYRENHIFTPTPPLDSMTTRILSHLPHRVLFSLLLPLYHFNANIRGFTSTGPSLNHCQGSESQHARVKSRANPRPQEWWALPFKSSSRGTNALATKLWCLKVHISVVKRDTDICHTTQPFLGIYPREKKTDVPTKPSPQMLRALLHAMAPKRETTRMSINRAKR